MKKRKLLALCLVPALLAGCAAPAGVTDLSRQFEAGDPAPPEAVSYTHLTLPTKA